MSQPSGLANPKRGEIWDITFDPSVGGEIQKTRPAIVIGIDSVGRLPLRIVIPITDWKSEYGQFPWMVALVPMSTNGLSKPSAADAFQVKSVSLLRFQKHLGVLLPAKVDDLAAAVALCVGYTP
jgi:mRNA interferase MazF